jgi:hypothetical protein
MAVIAPSLEHLPPSQLCGIAVFILGCIVVTLRRSFIRQPSQDRLGDLKIAEGESGQGPSSDCRPGRPSPSPNWSIETQGHLPPAHLAMDQNTTLLWA